MLRGQLSIQSDPSTVANSVAIHHSLSLYLMKHMVRASRVFLALTVGPVLVAAGQTSHTKRVETTLTLKALNGQEQALADYRGKIVVLNFWATWCVPCRAEMPLLVEMQQRYADRGVQVIAPSADEPGTQARIPAFVKKLKLNFPVWVGATTADMKRLELGEALPATAIFDRDGMIVARIIGPVDRQDLEQRLDWLSGDRQGPAPQALINTFEKHKGEHRHHGGHEGEEEHHHGNVGVEGASTVPS
jgi:thiol-disulfide isomerase/thioredoxin